MGFEEDHEIYGRSQVQTLKESPGSHKMPFEESVLRGLSYLPASLNPPHKSDCDVNSGE